MQRWDVGETRPFRSRWFNSIKEGVEPSAITLTIDRPSGAQIVKTKADLTGTASDGTGPLDTWTWFQVLTVEGVWRYRFSGTIGSETVVEEGLIVVGDASRSPGPFEPWATWDDVTALCPNVDLSSVAIGTREHILDLATWILYSLDGRRYPGIGQVRRSICRTCAACSTSCCCHPRGSIDLRRAWPVLAVWDVTVAGVTLPSTAYQLRSSRWLDRIDGDTWPACGDLTDPDAFALTEVYGRRPPIGLSEAAARFSAEMAKSCVPGVKCELPARVTSVTREGVSYTILDPQRFIDEGKVGIYLVDLALEAARRGRKPGPGAFSPYAPGARSSRVG